MKMVSSIGNRKKRTKDCQIIRRGCRIYVLSTSNPRVKVRQGRARMKYK